MSSQYDSDFSDYDPYYELQRLGDNSTKRMVLLDSDEESSAERFVAKSSTKASTTSIKDKKVVVVSRKAKESITTNRTRHITRNDIVVNLRNVSNSTALLDLMCDFVTSVGEKKCGGIMEMINHFHRRSHELPYPKKKTIPCTRLELESWMRHISVDKYNEFLAKLATEKVHMLVEGHSPKMRTASESNISSLMYESYVGRYVCVNDGKSVSVWVFDSVRWKEISQAEIWQEMSVDFVDFLQSFSKMDDIGWDNMRDDVAKYLASVSVRERIQRDLLHRLTNNTFQSQLNAKPHLVGMLNGVYDFAKGSLRDALPMDYVSMSTHNNYLEEDDDVLRNELKEILRTIFPNKRVRKFFIQSCASLLEGRNREKYVYIWWGKGNNAKSMMEKLLATALGDYATIAATSLVTSKRGNADAASPQLSALEGKLAVFLQEPNPNETIKIGMIKELSGNDAITARALFKGNRTFIPKFKLIIVCNTAIEIPNIDMAFTNRLIVIPFESTFRTEEDYRRRKKKGTLTKYDHLLDASFASKIAKYAEIFFRMLVEEYEAIGDEPLCVPRRIRKATTHYIEENNFSLRFIKEQCIETDGESGTGVKALHSELRNWMTQHHGGKKVPNIDIFREEIVNRGYIVDVKGTVYGLMVDYE